MLHLIAARLLPAPLHRLALRAAHGLRKIWWRLARPQLVGVAVVLVDGQGRALLVRHTYDNGKWTLPGGGLERGELPDQAARREMREELGCAVHGLEPIAVNRRILHGAPCVTHIFAAPLGQAVPRPDRREVAELGFFVPEDLPEGRTALVDEAVAMAGRLRG